MNPKYNTTEADVSQSFKVFPREFDKKLSDYFDKRYIAILCASLFVHLSVVFYFMTNPPSRAMTDKDIEFVQKRFAKLVLEQPVVEEIEPPAHFAQTQRPIEKPDAKEEVEQLDRQTAPRPRKKQPSTAEERRESRSQATAQRRRTQEQIKSQVSTQGLLGLLSSTSSSASGGEVQDVLGQGLPTTNLEEQLKGVSGTRRARAGETPGGSRTVRGGREISGGSIDDLVTGPEKSAITNNVSRSGELEVGATTSLLGEDDREILQGARDQDAVSSVVQSHNAAIQYCYQRALRRNPNLRGKIVVRFTITPQGAVSKVSILSSTLDEPSVESCIVSRIKRWNDFGAIDPSKGETTIRQVYTFGY